MMKEIVDACLSFGTKYYTLSQVVLATCIGRSIVRHNLWKLENIGFITRIKCWETPLPGFSKGRPTKEICYRNTKLLKHKPLLTSERKENTWDTMWKTIRVLRKFTHTDLVTICGQDLNNVRFFVRRYRDLGYIRKQGKRDRETLWILIRDAGPLRPLRRADELD
jgi:hypothetical protein